MYTFCLNPYNKPYENILELILYVIFDEKTCKNSWKTIKRKLEMNSKWKIMKKCNINEKKTNYSMISKTGKVQILKFRQWRNVWDSKCEHNINVLDVQGQV